MSRSTSRTGSKEKRNRSMLSTHHMSNNYSHATNFFNESKANKSGLLTYSEVPFEKVTPRWNQSAATWRNTSHKYSFSKDSRFKEFKVEYNDIIEPQIPSTNSNKSCTFGKGNKKPISQVVLRNATQKPAPNRYDIKSSDQKPRSKSRGKSFGLGWKAYEKIYIPHRKDIYHSFQNQDNPPAKYHVRENPGKEKKKFSMYGRLKMYTQKLADDTKWVPGSKYEVNGKKLQNQAGLNDRSFGFGEKVDLSMPANNYPGAKYIIPGFCNKFQQQARKSLGAMQNTEPLRMSFS